MFYDVGNGKLVVSGRMKRKQPGDGLMCPVGTRMSNGHSMLKFIKVRKLYQVFVFQTDTEE